VSFSQRLQTELEGIAQTNENVAMALNFVIQSATRQQALVRDIQLYLAATVPRANVELTYVPDVLAKAIEYNAQLIAQTNADVDYRLLPAVVIDSPRLLDIFNILLDNALRYRKLDCVPRIRIYGQAKGKRTFYYVEDNGVGIKPEYRERVFLVFERLQVNHGDQNSTGVGLAIVKRIVESCGGAIKLTDTADGGTTVIFDLPNSF
jgi:light-regulated signal transduction histidine kinase (bacteriophytochrome)